MEDLKKIQEFFSKPLEEGKQLDIVDFAKVVQAVTKTGHPVTVLLTPKFNEIEVLTGMNAPDDMLFDLSNAVDSLGYGRNDIIIAADSSNLSRREYSDIRRVNGGHKDYFEESLDEQADHVAPMVVKAYKEYLEAKKEGNGEKAYRYYSKKLNNTYSTRADRDAIEAILKKKYGSAMEESLDEAKKLTYNNFVQMVRDDMMAGAAPDEYPSDERVRKDAKYLYNRYLQGASVDDLFEAVNENALGFNDSRLSSDQHRDLDYAVRGDSAYTFGNDPYADDQLRYKYAVKMGFLEEATKEEETEFHKKLDKLVHDTFGKRKGEMEENMSLNDQAKAYFLAKVKKGEIDTLPDNPKAAFLAQKLKSGELDEYNTGIYYDPAKERNAPKAKEASKVGLEKVRDMIKKIMKEDLADFEEKDADYDKLYSDYLYKMVKEVATEKGYSKYLVSKDNPKGETSGLDTKTMNKILMNVIKDLDETIKLGKNLNEELCPKGKAYIKKRKAAGEKSSAYLSGRAVKVCKGQMKG